MRHTPMQPGGDSPFWLCLLWYAMQLFQCMCIWYTIGIFMQQSCAFMLLTLLLHAPETWVYIHALLHSCICVYTFRRP